MLSRYLKTLSVIFSLLLITACAPMKTVETASLADVQDGGAFLVGMYVLNPNKQKYDVESFFFHNIETKESYRIHTQNAMDPFTAKTKYQTLDANSIGVLFAFKLPAGKYKFDSFVLSEGQKQIRGYNSLDTEFEVVSGAPSYLGAFRNEVIMGKNFFGMSIPAGSILMISDKSERDLPIIKAKYPDLNWDEVVVVTPEPNVEDGKTHVIGRI